MNKIHTLRARLRHAVRRGLRPLARLLRAYVDLVSRAPLCDCFPNRVPRRGD